MGNLQDGRRKPLLIYDGECAYCTRQVERLRRWTHGALDLEPYQTAAARFPSIPPDAFRRAVQFVDTSGAVSSGAEAAFRALATNPRLGGFLWCYERVPGVAAVSERVYRLVARNRGRL